MTELDHPPYSRDSAPCEFSLFLRPILCSKKYILTPSEVRIAWHSFWNSCPKTCCTALINERSEGSHGLMQKEKDIENVCVQHNCITAVASCLNSYIVCLTCTSWFWLLPHPVWVVPWFMHKDDVFHWNDDWYIQSFSKKVSDALFLSRFPWRSRGAQGKSWLCSMCHFTWGHFLQHVLQCSSSRMSKHIQITSIQGRFWATEKWRKSLLLKISQTENTANLHKDIKCEKLLSFTSPIRPGCGRPLWRAAAVSLYRGTCFPSPFSFY